MDTQTVQKTFKYKLKPTPEQEQAMAFVVRRCRELYNAALQERKEAWQKRGISVSVADQSAQLPAIKEVRPEYHGIHSQVLQDVLARLDKAFQAFFRRIRTGQTPGYPRFQSVSRYNSFTYKQFGNGATLDNGFLMLSKIGRIAVRWSRPLEGAPKTVTVSKEADGVVCLLLMRGGASPATPSYRTGNRDRPGHRGVCYPVEWHTHLLSRLVSQSRKGIEDSAAACEPSQEGEQSAEESGHTVGEGASDGAPSPAGLPSQDGIGARARQRCDLSRGLAGPQHGSESPPGEVHSGRRVERIPGHPERQSCECWENSASG
jgi:hypothetical protein